MIMDNLLSISRICCGLRLSLFILSCLACSSNSETDGKYLNKWAVHLEQVSDPNEVDEIAKTHGFMNHGQIGTLENYYLFEHHGVSKRSTHVSPRHNHLQKHPKVRWVEQQVVKKRVKRDYSTSYPNLQDPLWEKQWYLHGGANEGYDMNIIPAWKKGFTGKGVVVTILDDGIEHSHPDLKTNYDPEASWDINGRDSDPMPHYDGSDTNRHGTRCAGEVAAIANNTKCAVGVAFNARIGGVRMLDGDVSDYVEAQSLSLNPQHIDIYSASWGPDDNGKVVDGPAKLAKEAFIQGILKGRNGKGSIFVWASGNGGSQYDSCNCDGYTNSLFTLSISSVSERGRKPWYLEECSSTMATTYSSGENYGDRKVITTDLHGKCTEAHTGTSASAPLAAAICALALEANPGLTWRDMQYIVMRTARPEPLLDGDWIINGVGKKVSLKYGYGLMDADALVDLAQRWTTVPEQHICASSINVLHMPIYSEGIELKVEMDNCEGTANTIRHLEHVQAKVSLRYSRRGDVQLHLTSPNGTRTMLLQKRKNDYQEGEFRDWPFMSVHYWGENPAGSWKLEVENVGSAMNTGTFIQWQLITYGTETDPVDIRPMPERPTTVAPKDKTTDTSTESTDLHFGPNDKVMQGKHTQGGKHTKNGKQIGLNEAWNHDSDDYDDTDNDSFVVKDEHSNLQDGEDGDHIKTDADIIKQKNGESKDGVNTENESWLPSKDWNFGQIACHYECDAKFGCRGPNAEDCDTCLNTRLSPSGPCVGECPGETYSDEDTGLCLPCDPSCGTCSRGSPSDCITCPEDRFLFNANHSCLHQCPTGYLHSQSGGRVCGPCALPCLSCEGSPDHCLSCEPDWELQDNTCQPPCQLFHYRNNDVCEPCVENCEMCTGPAAEDCVACGHARLLQNHTCVFACSQRFFPIITNHGQECLECHPSCLNCNGGGEDECIECSPPRTLHKKKCLFLCPDGQYKTEENTCESCDQSCLTCSGKSGYDCLSCHPERFLHNEECMTECPAGYYPTTSNNAVSLCAKCLPPCIKCQDSATHCTACPHGFRLQGSSCSMHCDSGEYRGREGCESCHATCLECKGPEVSHCSSCPASHHLHHGACLSDCPKGYYGVQEHCHICDDSCLSCNGGGSGNCMGCSTSLRLVEGACVPAADNASGSTATPGAAPLAAQPTKKCDDGYFLNSSTQVCSGCDESCATCDGWGPYRCVTCASPHRFYTKLNSCVLCCSDAVNKTCCSCHPKTGVCIENRNIDYENIPHQERQHMLPTQRSIKNPHSKQRGSTPVISQNGILAVVVVFCFFSFIIFVVIFGVLQARSNKKMCWYRHYQPVPMYYHGGSEQVTLSKEDYLDEDSGSSSSV